MNAPTENAMDSLKMEYPSRNLAPEVPDMDRADEDLRAILRGPRTDAPDRDQIAKRPKGQISTRRVFAGIGVAAAAALLFTAQPWSTGSGGSAFAATPEPLHFGAAVPNSGKQLGELAAKVRTLHESPADGTAYVKTQGWYLNSRDDNGDVQSRVEPTTNEQWVSRDGSVVSRRDGSHVEKSAGAAMWSGVTFASDPSQLKAQLSIGHPIADDGTGELFVAVGDLYRESNPSPAVRAGLLTLLAQAPGVTSTGPVIDRAGRSGDSFSVMSSMTGLPTRMTLIFDPVSGQLLDHEDMLTETAGALKVAIPAVTSYTLFLSNGGTAPSAEVVPGLVEL